MTFCDHPFRDFRLLSNNSRKTKDVCVECFKKFRWMVSGIEEHYSVEVIQ